MSVDIVHTVKGSYPVVKTYERDAYNEKKWVKALKFYSRDELGIAGTKDPKQFKVNEGYIHKNYNN